jgi:hypothetical protein
MTVRTDRLARNEAAFRMLNERALAVTQELAREGFGSEPDLLECVCECSNDDCTVVLRLRREDYELARADPGRFVVAPGHVDPTIEREIHQIDDGAVIVEKHPGERAITAATDPRA